MHRTAIVTRSEGEETLDLNDSGLDDLPMTTFSLHVVSGPDEGNILQLDPQGPPHATIGGASSCTVQLTDRHVSRKHIAVTATPTHLLLVDLGSTNGTRVNGVIVREARLYGGETIAIGRTVFRVETDRPRPPSADYSQQENPDLVSNVLKEKLTFPAARQRVVAEFEKRYIEDLLERHNGNVTHAARASGVAHRYFQLVRARTK